MRRVMVVVSDLFFATRIASTAKLIGVTVETASLGAALDRCRAAPPDLLIVDLHEPGDPLALARALEADEATRSIPMVGFYSHVDQPLREAALAAGVDRVMPRSAFTAQLPALLAGEAESEATDLPSEDT